MALINTTTTGVLGSTFYGDGTGDLTIQQNGVTVNKITRAPTFSAYLGSSQTISTGTNTKVAFSTERWDTDNCYDNGAASRFTPNVAGYYHVDCHAYVGGATNTFLNLFKNGSAYARGSQISGTVSMVLLTTTVFLNGTTDYIEMYLTNNTGSNVTVDPYDFTTTFAAFLVRFA